MIKEYGLFNHHDDNNTVVILFTDEKINNKKRLNEVTTLFHDNKLIGYQIDNFVRYAKIKYSGIIFLPSNILIDVINNILIDEGLETLDYKKESGYVTKMNNNKLGVFAKEGTFLRDETISKGRFCTYYDLFINSEKENELIIIDEDIKENIDFFMMEEK